MDKYTPKGPKSVGTPTAAPTRSPESRATPVERVLDMIEKTKWDDDADTSRLKEEITKFGKDGDMCLLQLINSTVLQRTASIWEKEQGRKFLRWMLNDVKLKEYFTQKPNTSMGTTKLSKRLPIHFAIERQNYSFLAAFLGICFEDSQQKKDEKDLGPAQMKDFQLVLTRRDSKLASEARKPKETKDRRATNTILESYEDDDSKENCLHWAVKKGLPFTAFMFAVCSAKALKDKDKEGYTPLHRALHESVGYPEPVPPSPVISCANAETARLTGRPFWDNGIHPPHILDEIIDRKDADDILPDILTTTNIDGQSPFQVDNLDKWRDEAGEEDFKGRFRSLVFEKVKDIRSVSKALYGTSGDVKELCLDMSDFNSSSHNFERFIDKLTKLDDTSLQFEHILFFVQLPDLNFVRQPLPHKTLQNLFIWLKDQKHVKTIKKLTIPDNAISPMNPIFFELNILDKFEIEALDWRILDMSLDILTGRIDKVNKDGSRRPTYLESHESLRDLTLYSSGNWSVLYHWLSRDGLGKLPNLESVRINIVRLDDTEGVHEKTILDRHLELANRYKKVLLEDHKSRELKYTLDIKVNEEWHYPQPPNPDDPRPRNLRHEFTGQLKPYHKFLENQMARKPHTPKPLNSDINGSSHKDQEDDDHGEDTNQDDDIQYVERLKQYAMPRPNPKIRDNRIRVAIIDNGADRIRSSIGEMIATGVSYVHAESSDRILPWWMVSDAHGTQMASLVGQVNPYCRLYIARVGRGRDNIDVKDAAKAIKWALEQKVDIISMSWTTPKDDVDLRKAIKEAASEPKKGRPTLMFCSTSDEGRYSGEIYPANYRSEVLRVSATDRWGQLTSQTRTEDDVDIRIPGENIEATGPSYMGSVDPTVSGSSVATALAAGIASLALLLLRTYNDLSEDQVKQLYTREGIMRVFRKMAADKGGIQLLRLFPRETALKKISSQDMANTWNIANFPGN